LIEIRELGLFWRINWFVRMGLVVELEGIVCVGEVLLGLRLNFGVSLNPVEKFRAVARVFCVSRLILLKSLVEALFSSSAASSPPKALTR